MNGGFARATFYYYANSSLYLVFNPKQKRRYISDSKNKRDRRGETLFIYARNLDFMKDRVLRDFTNDDIAKIADVFHAWQSGNYGDEKGDAQGGANVVEGRTPVATFCDTPGFCKSVGIEEIKKHDYVLTPGRFVGAADAEEDSEPFPKKCSD